MIAREKFKTTQPSQIPVLCSVIGLLLQADKTTVKLSSDNSTDIFFILFFNVFPHHHSWNQAALPA